MSTSPHGTAADTTNQNRASTGVSSRLRGASITFMESSPPLGMWQAAGEVASKAPSLAEIRRGSFGRSGWSEDGQRAEYERKNSTTSEVGSLRRRFSRTNSAQSPGSISHPTLLAEATDENESVVREKAHHDVERDQTTSPVPLTAPQAERHKKEIPVETTATRFSSSSISRPESKPIVPDENGYYPNGYRPPPKKSWGEATTIGLKAFWKFFLAPVGFFIVLYGLNVVAWGGMLFLLLCNAAPAMCRPTCNDINSPRRIWVEIDSQILNALFCVTGFGLIPWRFRDLYYLLQFRIFKKQDGLRRLAGIHRAWFRLPGSDRLNVLSRDGRDPTTSVNDHDHHNDDNNNDKHNSALPIPTTSTPSPPLTGVRAPPTKLWKLDFVIWAYVSNTFLQVVLSAFMWGYNRIERPSWSTGLFVALACIAAGMGGLMCFLEGKRVKKVEGIPVKGQEVLRDVELAQMEKKRGRSRKEKMVDTFGWRNAAA
ncbi:hypothetical protein MMC16_004237 [Acarospora aff. strigata]|nr:hypothetical protein [Acarospora aff. strigata]